MSAQKLKIGIYGGTFSPPHIGHTAAARAFLNGMSLDRLLIIPALVPPHKQISYPDDPAARLDMCRLAFGSLERTEVSDLEITRGGKSYTSDTLEELASDGRELFLLCGTDMILTLDEWHMPELIFRLATPVCIRRENDKNTEKALNDAIAHYRQKYGVTVPIINSLPVAVSSSEIRERLHNGESVSGLVPPDVEEYIRERRMYR